MNHRLPSYLEQALDEIGVGVPAPAPPKPEPRPKTEPAWRPSYPGEEPPF